MTLFLKKTKKTKKRDVPLIVWLDVRLHGNSNSLQQAEL